MKRIAGLILVMVLVFSLSSALAQRISCPDGGFTVTLPDHFVEESTGGDPELCFYWHGSKLTVQGYVSYLGEVAGSDLFEVLTGDEQETLRMNPERLFLSFRPRQHSCRVEKSPPPQRIKVTSLRIRLANPRRIPEVSSVLPGRPVPSRRSSSRPARPASPPASLRLPRCHPWRSGRPR